VEILGQHNGIGGAGPKNSGQKRLIQEVRERQKIEVNGTNISELYETKGNTYRLHKHAAKILSVLFELFKERELQESVKTLPGYSAGAPCIDIACPGLLTALAGLGAGRAMAASLLAELTNLRQSCPRA
jgi:predicted GNAT family acetyltransferase